MILTIEYAPVRAYYSSRPLSVHSKESDVEKTYQSYQVRDQHYVSYIRDIVHSNRMLPTHKTTFPTQTNCNIPSPSWKDSLSQSVVGGPRSQQQENKNKDNNYNKSITTKYSRSNSRNKRLYLGTNSIKTLALICK
jgi:hypothetical protein